MAKEFISMCFESKQKIELNNFKVDQIYSTPKKISYTNADLLMNFDSQPTTYNPTQQLQFDHQKNQENIYPHPTPKSVNTALNFSKQTKSNTINISDLPKTEAVIHKMPLKER